MTTKETMHTIPESTLVNPVLLAQYAVKMGLISQMVWLMWGLKWTKGLIAHVCESMPFDFAARSKEFTDYMQTYSNPFDVGAYEPKQTRKAESAKPSAKNAAKDNRPKPMPKQAESAISGDSSGMALDEYLQSEYSLTDNATYAILAALSNDSLSGYGSAIDYAIETHDNKQGKESVSSRKRTHAAIRLAMKHEYTNRKDYAAFVNGSAESDNAASVPNESPTIAASVPNQTDLAALVMSLAASVGTLAAKVDSLTTK